MNESVSFVLLFLHKFCSLIVGNSSAKNLYLVNSVRKCTSRMEALPFKDRTILRLECELWCPYDLHEYPFPRTQKLFRDFVIQDTYLSGGQSKIIVWLVVAIAKDSTEFTQVEARNMDDANHR